MSLRFFTQIPISDNQTSIDLDKEKIIDIIIKCRNENELPYHNLNSLKDVKIIKRETCDRVTLRGDNRSIEQIQEAGGFHPRWTISGEENKKHDPFDIMEHRECSMGSGFVSTTIDPKEAHDYGRRFASHGDSNPVNKNTVHKYTIYALNAIGAMTPTPPPSDNETEYSVPGGIDAEDIIAYRECTRLFFSENTETCSDIFFNNKYKKRYPELVEPVINAMLIGNEKIKR
jgi:hypothetical protein